MNLSFFSKMKKRNIDFTVALENVHDINLKSLFAALKSLLFLNFLA